MPTASTPEILLSGQATAKVSCFQSFPKARSSPRALHFYGKARDTNNSLIPVLCIPYRLNLPQQQGSQNYPYYNHTVMPFLIRLCDRKIFLSEPAQYLKFPLSDAAHLHNDSVHRSTTRCAMTHPATALTSSGVSKTSAFQICPRPGGTHQCDRSSGTDPITVWSLLLVAADRSAR